MASGEPTPFVITYFTHDLAANRRFYGDVLGLELHSERPDTYFLCGSDAARLQILAAGSQHGFAASDPPSSGLVTVGIDTPEELGRLRERLVAAGIDEELRQGEAGAQLTSYSDPDGRSVVLQLFNRSKPFHD